VEDLGRPPFSTPSSSLEVSFEGFEVAVPLELILVKELAEVGEDILVVALRLAELFGELAGHKTEWVNIHFTVGGSTNLGEAHDDSSVVDGALSVDVVKVEA
ncbi:hypothetical protein LTR17_021322, partial [Elasticomyces elasticus]